MHGVIDYVLGVLLILAPFALGFADNGPAQWVPITLGAAAILYSADERRVEFDPVECLRGCLRWN